MIWVKGFREEVAFRQETEGEIGVGQLVCIQGGTEEVYSRSV